MPLAVHHRERFYRRHPDRLGRSDSVERPADPTILVPLVPRTHPSLSISISRPDPPSRSGSPSISNSSIQTAETFTRERERDEDSIAMYKMPGTSPTPSVITPPDNNANNNDLPAPYLNLIGFPSNTTLTLDTPPVPDERPPLPPRPLSLNPEPTARPPAIPPRPRASLLSRESLTSLSSFSLSKSQTRPHSYAPSHSHSQSTSSSTATSTSTPKSPTKTTATNPTPGQSQSHSSKLSLPSLKYTPPASPASDLLTLTRHIETQTSQARHLFAQKASSLDSRERAWIESTISDAESATREVAVLTEALRVEQVTNQGKLGVKSQLRWFMRDAKRAREKQERLVVVHASLMAVLGGLQGVKPLGQGQQQSQGSIQGQGEGSAEMSMHMSGAIGYQQGGAEKEEEAGGYELDSQEQMRRRRGSTINKGTTIPTIYQPPPAVTRPIVEDNTAWDLSVQLQDAGMEAVVPNMVAEKVAVSVKTEPAKESAKMDNELMDMLSWRWAQGRAKT
ncbi:hypothetical protein BJY01DRAFT_212442 [Aspergillus pseudoustus]|uniref:Uncharacterized protein n=1 Tax=Aspergillus pseudoustus TaxID=1810923 RepID=A0ABR4K667_9EURO